MALVLTEAGIPGKVPVHGVVRLAACPDNEKAEYAIILIREMTGMGLGVVLMRRLVDHARARGIGTLYGDVLPENHTMLKLCAALGFRRALAPDDPEVVRVSLDLAGGTR